MFRGRKFEPDMFTPSTGFLEGPPLDRRYCKSRTGYKKTTLSVYQSRLEYGWGALGWPPYMMLKTFTIRSETRQLRHTTSSAIQTRAADVGFFTYPDTERDTNIYSRAKFLVVNRILSPDNPYSIASLDRNQRFSIYE